MHEYMFSILFFSAQQQSQHALKRPRSPSPQRSSIPPAYYRTPVHGPSVTKAAAYSTPTSAHASHYTSYPGSAVVSVGKETLEYFKVPFN